MKSSIVVISMGGHGHVQALMPVVSGLCRRGLAVYVLTENTFRSMVEKQGAQFIDLYERHPIDAADSTSTPVPSRYVSFAGFYGSTLSEYLATLNPSLIIYDMFAVVAPVVARLLDVPHVAVCPNHAPVAEQVIKDLHSDPRVSTSDACWWAVEQLRDVYGVEDASPFLYADGVSPYLNLYGEPEEFITADERAAIEPVEFYGVLSPRYECLKSLDTMKDAGSGRLRVYISFGTVIWWYFQQAAMNALSALVENLGRNGCEITISLGNQSLDGATRRHLSRFDTRLVSFTDQWCELSKADLFVTHNGLNSTHESIFVGTPMLSYPFFGDQPRLARRCQEMGLAVALTPAPLEAIDPAVIENSLDLLRNQRESFAERLFQAREWEQRIIDNREAILDQVLALTASGGQQG